MKVTIIIFCLMGAVFANPIFYEIVLEPSGLEANMTLSSSASQSSESDTSELQSSEENTSNQSSESSETSESTSEDKTSSESDSQSLEDRSTSMEETRDNSMASEENIRKGWIGVFANVDRVVSDEDYGNAEVKGQPDHLANKHAKNHTPTTTGATLGWAGTTAQSNKNLSETSQDSSDDSDLTGVTDSSQSSESTSSETSETSDSRDTSESTESDDASDSADLDQIKAKNCLQGVDSTDCESEEYLFRDIGDDAYVDYLMMPGEEHRELSVRR